MHAFHVTDTYVLTLPTSANLLFLIGSRPCFQETWSTQVPAVSGRHAVVNFYLVGASSEINLSSLASCQILINILAFTPKYSGQFKWCFLALLTHEAKVHSIQGIYKSENTTNTQCLLYSVLFLSKYIWQILIRISEKMQYPDFKPPVLTLLVLFATS